MSITVTPTGAALGAEVGGIDLRRISDVDFAAIYRAWLDIWCCCSAGRR